MLLEKFSNIIDHSPIGAAVGYRQQLIKELDPNRIDVENIRHFFGIQFKLAKWLCDIAVTQGAFERRIGLQCPNCDSMLGDFSENDKIPEIVSCENCKRMGEEQINFKSSSCQKIPFYKIVKNG
jgi:hypothetical protein